MKEEHVSCNIFFVYSKSSLPYSSLQFSGAKSYLKNWRISLIYGTWAVAQTCSTENVFWEISLQACNFIIIETLAQVFFCEFCEISKSTFSYRTPAVAASVRIKNNMTKTIILTCRNWGIVSLTEGYLISIWTSVLHMTHHLTYFSPIYIVILGERRDSENLSPKIWFSTALVSKDNILIDLNVQ